MPLDSLKFDISDKDAKTEPQPGNKSRRGRPSNSATHAKVERELRDQLTAALKFGAMMWSTKDPVCAPILNEQSELIAADLAKMASKSKWAKKWLTEVAEIGEFIPFLMHIQPVLMTVYTHHIAPAIEARNERSVRDDQTEEEMRNHAGYGAMG